MVSLGGIRNVALFQLMPLYVMDSLGGIPAMAGLYTAGIFSGSLSTVSSALNSLAAIALEDYLKVASIFLFVFGDTLRVRYSSLTLEIAIAL